LEKIVLHGGGKSAFDMFEDFARQGIVDGMAVAYVPIAFEYFDDIKQEIKNDEHIYVNKLVDLGAKSALIVFTDNFDEMFKFDTIILGGGYTDYLFEKLRDNHFDYKLSKSNVKNLAGSSAGALAIARKGIGIRDNKEHMYHGFGILDEFIVVHSNDEAKRVYPDAVHLDEDQSKCFNI